MAIRFSEIDWPAGPSYRVANARVPACLLDDATAAQAAVDPEGVLDADLLIAHGKLARVVPSGTAGDFAGVPGVDVGGRQVWPTLIDIHTHLDKGHIVGRSPNLDGTHVGARLACASDRPSWSVADLRRRMDFGLRCAYAHGVTAIRTHIDTYPDNAERSWQALREMRDDWRGRVDLQAVALCPIDLLAGEFGDRVAALVAQSGGLLGGVTRSSVGDDAALIANLDALLDRVFALAARHDLAVDLHVDETHDVSIATLPSVAHATVRHGYTGHVTCGHCCSVAMQPEAEIDRTLDLVAQAGIGIVTLPTVNMYLQDRNTGRTPRWRGVTVVREMLARGIKVAAAGDNCRDGFYAYGDHDVLDTFREAVKILHMDHPVTGAPSLVGTMPAAIGQFDGHGRLTVGAPARLIVFNARTINEIVSRPHSDRIVIDHGARLRAAAPDYSELWDADGGAGGR
jgi:cytosine deaminase